MHKTVPENWQILTTQNKIAEQISTLAPAVEDEVVKALVNRQLNKRSTAVVSAVDLLERLEIDLRKINPEKTYDKDGNVVSEYYTKQKLEERNKLLQKIEKLNKALNKALEKSDYGDLYNLGSGESKSES